jgi:hypothetical protein
MPGAADALVAAVLLAACTAIGFSLLPASLRRRARLAVPLALSLGCTAVGWVGWIAGSVIGTVAVVPAVLVLLGQSARTWRECAAACRRWLRMGWLLVRSHPWLAALVVAFLATLAPQLLLPITDSDGLRYHLGLPKLYLLTGRIFPYPYDFTGALPQLAEMLYLIGLELGHPETAKFLHAGMFVATLGALAATVHSSRTTRAPALVAALAFAATPVAFAVVGTAFVEHFAMFHCAVALLLAAGGAPPAAVGCALGGALGTRLTVVPLLAALALLVIARAGRGGRLRAAAWFLLPIAIIAFPFAARNVVRTGDPFFPLGRGLLGLPIPGAGAERVKITTDYHADSPRFLGITWGTSQGPAQADEIAGWHNLLALFALALAVTDRRMRLFALPVALFLVLGLWFRPPTRYLLPMFLCLAGLGALALARTRRRWGPWAGVALIAPAAVTSAHFVLSYRAPLSYLLGREDRAAFMARSVPGWKAARFVNAQPPGGRVMALDFPAPFLFDRPWLAEGMLVKPPLQEWLERGGDAAQLLDRLRREDVRYLVVTPGYGGGTPASLLPLATSAAQRRRVLQLRAKLERLATLDGVDVFAVPAR